MLGVDPADGGRADLAAEVNADPDLLVVIEHLLADTLLPGAGREPVSSLPSLPPHDHRPTQRPAGASTSDALLITAATLTGGRVNL
jgi:hypothetical protein